MNEVTNEVEQQDEASFEVESFDVSDASVSERQFQVTSPYSAKD